MAYPFGEASFLTGFLSLPEGEHRYTYILEDGHSFADPTIPARETDDFGGQNTIIDVRYNT